MNNDHWLGAHGHRDDNLSLIDIPALEATALEEVCEEYNRAITLIHAEYIPAPLYPGVRLIVDGKIVAIRDLEQRQWELAAQPLCTYDTLTNLGINRFERILREVARAKFFKRRT